MNSNDFRMVSLGNNNLNSVYKFELDNKKYVLRISKFNNNFESKVLKLLNENNLKCPIINNNFTIDNKYIMICNYIEGNMPVKLSAEDIRKIIIEVKKLHSVKFNYLETENINYESIEKLNEYSKLSLKSKYLKNDRALIIDYINSINNNLKLTLLPRYIVHSDIKTENIVVSGKDIYLIDFGNVYIGNRLIDVIRIIMWFFIRYDNFDLKQIKMVVEDYFDEKNKMTKEELENIDDLIVFCLLYNLLKDIYLHENGALSKEYVEDCSLKWLDTLKNKEKLKIIAGVFKNVKGFTK